MKREGQKMYVVRKYVKAISVAQALRREKDAPVHEIFVEDKWKDTHLADAIGFAETEVEEEDEE